jgi:hypothetical protein
MAGIIEELEFRAWQERASATIGRTTKSYRDAHEHAAHALECLAADLKRAGLTEDEDEETDETCPKCGEKGVPFGAHCHMVE